LYEVRRQKVRTKGFYCALGVRSLPLRGFGKAGTPKGALGVRVLTLWLLAFALYLFEVRAKLKQSRNLEEVFLPLREERRILLLYLIRGVPPIKGGIKNPWR
jgi:hypothetical protein